MKHTKGPWRVGDAGHTVFGKNEGKPSPEIVCCNLTKANAALIASAPELLDALEILMRHFDRSEVNASGEVVPANINRKFAAVDIARKAIRKARG